MMRWVYFMLPLVIYSIRQKILYLNTSLLQFIEARAICEDKFLLVNTKM